MNKKGEVIWLSLILVFSLIVIIVEIAPVFKAPIIIYVDDVPGSGPSNPAENFTSIQDAINASSDGDTVFVYNGTYYENVIVNKSINLFGEDIDNTTINGGGSGDVVFISAAWVNVSGFLITGSGTGSEDAGIHVNSDNNRIYGNNISSNGYNGIYVGIFLALWNNYNLIEENIVLTNGNNGITIIGDHNVISMNFVSFNSGNGIAQSDSENNVISNNTIIGAFYGIPSQRSNFNEITYNYVASCSFYGIRLTISHNNKVTNNILTQNSDAGMYIASTSTSNTIYHNNFINNNVHAYDYGSNTWYLPIPIGGNYWDTWTTPDNNGDGFVDNPYMIPGGSNFDFLPFTEKNRWLPVHNFARGVHYPTIGEAIHDAWSNGWVGDRIDVDAGIYNENIIINITLELVGEDMNTTIINGNGFGDVVSITVDGVNITGFTITGSGSGFEDAGIELGNVQSCLIENNNCSNNTIGISIRSNLALTDNGYDDRFPEIHNGQVVWQGYDGNDYETFFWDRGNTIQLTDNDVLDERPEIHNGQVVWHSHDGDYEIYFWNGSSTIRLTNNGNEDWQPRIHSGHVIWMCRVIGTYEVYLWNGTGIQRLTNNGYSERDHETHNGQVVWRVYDGNDFEVYFWNGSSTKRLTNNNVDDWDCQLHNGKVAWTAAEADYEIYFWNGSSTTKLTNNGVSDTYPDIHNGLVVWKGYDGNDNEIFLWDGTSTIQVTNTNYWEEDPGIHNGQVIWCAQLGDYEIFYWDGEITSRLTDNAYHDWEEEIHNGEVVWEGDDGNDFEIYLYRKGKNTIKNNYISDNERGVYLEWSRENNITDNTIINNDYGIFLSQSNYNNITRNNISSNINYGLYLNFSSKNRIYHNDILNNTNQAYDNSNYGNQWDIGYPLGGNYWSDYGGVDNFKGPNQNIPGSDGIGDVAYSNIDGGMGAEDRYPLWRLYSPLENYTILKPDWYLISIPLIQEEQNLTRVLGSIDGWYDAVQWFNNSDSNDPWKHNKIGKPFGNDLFELYETMGFWIHIIQPGDTIFLYNGTQPTVNQTITLHPGWNQVGYPSLRSYNRTEGLNNLSFGSEVDSILTYDAATQKWEEIGSSDYFELGRGYWIHAKTSCEWEVPL